MSKIGGQPTVSNFLAATLLTIATSVHAQGSAARGPSAPMPPGEINTEIRLCWTAPGDDGMEGNAFQYDLRYSRSPINAENFAAAASIPTMPSPLPPGEQQCVRIRGLPALRGYDFAIKASDERSNWSSISNVITAQVDDPHNLGSENDLAPNETIIYIPSLPVIQMNQKIVRTGGVEITTQNSTAGECELEIFDAQGRRVRRMREKKLAGALVQEWDLRDNEGRRIGVGVFFVRVRFRDDLTGKVSLSKTERLVVLH